MTALIRAPSGWHCSAGHTAALSRLRCIVSIHGACVYLVLEMVIFSRFGAPLKHRYKEKIRNTKTADILLLERLPEQIVTNFEVFTPYCTVPYI